MRVRNLRLFGVLRNLRIFGVLRNLRIFGVLRNLRNLRGCCVNASSVYSQDERGARSCH